MLLIFCEYRKNQNFICEYCKKSKPDYYCTRLFACNTGINKCVANIRFVFTISRCTFVL